MATSEKSKTTLSDRESSGWTLKAALAAAVAVLLYYTLSGWNSSESSHPSVTIKQGTILGRLVDDGTFPQPLEGFMGIPYALPPTGQRRFREAVPVPEGNLTQEAFYLGPRSDSYDSKRLPVC